ncbi:hypothetical protein D3C84_1197020 [compost metagenome]
MISLTRFRFLSGIFSMTSITDEALVPNIIATMVPFLPLPDLFVKIVYNSPLERQVSSIDKRFPRFSGNKSHCFACDF